MNPPSPTPLASRLNDLSVSSRSIFWQLTDVSANLTLIGRNHTKDLHREHGTMGVLADWQIQQDIKIEPFADGAPRPGRISLTSSSIAMFDKGSPSRAPGKM